MARNPHVQQQVFEEAKKILPNCDDDQITDMTKDLSYSRAVLKETFRMNPVSVGVGRTTNTDLILGGYNVPKGVSYTDYFEFDIVLKYFLIIFFSLL